MPSNTTIQQLIDRSREYDTHKTDVVRPARDAHFTDQMHLHLDGEPLPMSNVLVAPVEGTLTDDATGQLYDKLGRVHFKKDRALPKDYLNAFPPAMQAQILNLHLNQAATTRWMYRMYDDRIRAVLAADYPKTDSTRLLELTRDTLAATGVQPEAALLVRPHLSADDLNLQVVFKSVDIDMDQYTRNGGSRVESYGLGVSIQNDETGRGGIGCYPLVWRTQCTNSLVRQNESSLHMVHHRAYSGRYLTMRFAETLVSAFNLAGEMLDTLLKAELEDVPNFAKVIAGIGNKYDWGKDVLIPLTQGAGGRETRAGLVNGLTYAAHTVFGEDVGQRTRLEGLASEFLFMPAYQLARHADIQPKRATRR